jgi:hypothetical protein
MLLRGVVLAAIAVGVAAFAADCGSSTGGATTLWAGSGDGAHQVASGTVEEMLAKGSAQAGFELKLPGYVPAGTHVSNINLGGGADDNPNTHGAVAVIHIEGSHGSYYLAEFKGVLEQPKDETWGSPPPGLGSPGEGVYAIPDRLQLSLGKGPTAYAIVGVHRSYTIEADADGSEAVELPKMVKSLVAD